MEPFLRFKTVEIDSKVYLNGKKRRLLHYPVRSISLIPEPGPVKETVCKVHVPEIFWQ